MGPGAESRIECHTPLRIRSPEAQFVPSQLGLASDVWTLACVIFELAGDVGQLFFGAFFLTQDSVTGDWVDALGKLPQEWWDSGRRVERTLPRKESSWITHSMKSADL